MFEKRGQLTLFLMVAVIIIIIIIFSFYILNPDFLKLKDFSKDNLDYCISEVYRDSLDNIGLMGGFYNSESASISLGKEVFNYHFMDNERKFPEFGGIKENLAKIVDEEIINCFDENDNMIYNYNRTEVKFDNDGVYFNSILKIILNEKGTTREIDYSEEDFFVESNLLKMIEISNFILDDVIESNGEICITCVNNQINNTSLSVEILYSESSDNIFFIIKDIKNPEMFIFVINYSLEESLEYGRAFE
jgi:hypothetical protein